MKNADAQESNALPEPFVPVCDPFESAQYKCNDGLKNTESSAACLASSLSAASKPKTSGSPCSELQEQLSSVCRSPQYGGSTDANAPPPSNAAVYHRLTVSSKNTLNVVSESSESKAFGLKHSITWSPNRPLSQNTATTAVYSNCVQSWSSSNFTVAQAPATNLHAIGAAKYYTSLPNKTEINEVAKHNAESGLRPTLEEKIIGYNTVNGKEHIISETIVEREIKVPRRVIRKDCFERLFVVPETVMREDIIEDVHKVQERVTQVAKPLIREKLVEVNHIEYREKPVEIIKKITHKKVKHVPRVEYKERIVHVPKYVLRERLVEVPQIEYRKIPVEKIVEVPEVREKFIIKPIPVPQYVTKPVPHYVTVEKPVDVQRRIPVPVEAVTTVEYQIPQMQPKIHKVPYPLYVPKFIETPVPAEIYNEMQLSALQQQLENLPSTLTGPRAPGLQDVEHLAVNCRQSNAAIDFAAQMTPQQYEAALTKAWKLGKLGPNAAEAHTTLEKKTTSNFFQHDDSLRQPSMTTTRA